MRKAIIILICISMGFIAHTQTERNYEQAIEAGDNALTNGNYRVALDKYLMAGDFDHEDSNSAVIKEKIEAIFDKIDLLRENAEKDKRRAEKAYEALKKAKTETKKISTQLEKEVAVKNKIFREAIEAWAAKNNVSLEGEEWKEKITKLDLSDRALTTLPEGLFELKNLQRLDLENNKLRQIPLKLGKLKHLESLYLRGNPKLDFRSVCKAFIGFPKKMIISNGTDSFYGSYEYTSTNRIRKESYLKIIVNVPNELPIEIGQLDNLLMLKLDNDEGGIKKIPAEIIGLKNLKILNLQGHQLQKIPNKIGALNSLKILDLSSNDLKEIPESIGQLRQLEFLDLGYNKLKKLPAKIGNLKALKYLKIHNNKLETLPATIGKLTQFSKLNLSRNQLKTIPLEIANLKDLEALDLRLNPDLDLKSLCFAYKDFSKSIGIYTTRSDYRDRANLKIYLNDLKTLPAEIEQLTSLISLDLSDSDLVSLPLELSDLKKLRTVDLRNMDSLQLNSVYKAFEHFPNQIVLTSNKNRGTPDTSQLLIKISQQDSISPEISRLKNNLVTLDLNSDSRSLSSNRLMTIPAEIGDLQVLKKLILEGNDIIKLPSTLGKIKTLKELTLTGNSRLDFNSCYEAFYSSSKRIIISNYRSSSHQSFDPNFSSSNRFRHNLNPGNGRSSDLPDDLLVITVPHTNISLQGIGKIENLVKLELTKKWGQEKSTSLFPKISALKKLEELNLTGFNFTKIPSQIGDLDALRILNLQHNNLKKIPARIKELKNLNGLYLSGNEQLDLAALCKIFYDYPKDIIVTTGEEPRRANTLIISIDKENKLPIELGKMKSVKVLNFSYSDIKELPLGLGELPQLSLLDLSDNDSLDIGQVFTALAHFPKKVIIDNEYGYQYPEERLQQINSDTLFIRLDKFHDIPHEIKHLEHLVNLKINDADLISLPRAIGKLKDLEILDLAQNKLYELPKEIRELHNLKTLKLAENNLSTLRANINELNKLEVLDLSSNDLKSLPKQMGKMTALRELNLIRNDSLDMKTVFSSFAKFPRNIVLTNKLNRNENDTTSLFIRIRRIQIPPEIEQLKNLIGIDFSSDSGWNRFDSHYTLPSYIKKLKKLQQITLQRTNLKTVPKELKELNNLLYLDLSHNHLTTIPKELGDLHQLKVLDISENHNLDLTSLFKAFKDFPGSIAMMADNGRNNIYDYDQSDLMVIIDGDIESIPPEIGLLKNLKALYLGEVSLKEIPTEIGQLQHLKSLYIHNNSISQLPVEVQNLKALTWLTLNGNPLSEEEEKRIQKLLPDCEIRF